VALENVFLREAPSQRWVVSFLFGSSTDSASPPPEPTSSPTRHLALALLGFNLGVEAARRWWSRCCCRAWSLLRGLVAQTRRSMNRCGAASRADAVLAIGVGRLFASEPRDIQHLTDRQQHSATTALAGFHAEG